MNYNLTRILIRPTKPLPVDSVSRYLTAILQLLHIGRKIRVAGLSTRVFVGVEVRTLVDVGTGNLVCLLVLEVVIQQGLLNNRVLTEIIAEFFV